VAHHNKARREGISLGVNPEEKILKINILALTLNAIRIMGLA
jgi:hypothetical protein